MEDMKWPGKKFGLLFVILIFLTAIGCIIIKHRGDAMKQHHADIISQENMSDEVISDEVNETSVWEKGYDLPVDKEEADEAEKECMQVASSVEQLIKENGKLDFSDKSTIDKIYKLIIDTVSEMGYPILETGVYPELHNYEKMDSFLKNISENQVSEMIVYELHAEGGFAREKFYYDGKDMYQLFTNIDWTEEGKKQWTSTSYCRIKEWSYTDKGWFCYELCVPEWPDVTEVVIGDMMMRVSPLDETYRKVAIDYLLPIGYRGNNLLCSEWDAKHMEKLDYNGLFEYFYAKKNGEKIDAKKYSDGIPEEEFIEMMQTYLPISADKIKEYAVYNSEKNVFEWGRLGCMNYAPTAFGTSAPEITDMKTNEDGTVTITIDAVCEMRGSDKIFSHELTVKFLDDGGIEYLGNHVLEPGLENVPKYQYRLEHEY